MHSDWQRLFAEFAPGAAGFWLLLDMAVAVIAWIVLRWLPLRWRNLAFFWRRLLIAYCGLLVGAISPRWMGLSGIDWQSSLALGVGAIVAVAAALLFVYFWYSSGESLLQEATPPSSLSRSGQRIYAILFAGAEQFHWSFLRACVTDLGLAVAANAATGAYWALWIAALLALPEMLMTKSALHRIVSLTALVATTVLFLYVRNFWLAWALHALIVTTISAAPIRAVTVRDGNSVRMH